MNEKISEIIKHFKFSGNLIKIEENNQGNINKTYVLTYDDNKEIKKYLLQKINSNVFTEPYLVMKNIELVTNHIKKKLKEENDTIHKTLNIIKTTDNKNLYTFINSDGEKEYYRAFDFIENCISYDSLNESGDSSKLAYEAGKSFGFFQKLLNDFPINLLGETIKDFHNTKKRFNDLLLSIENKITNRAYDHADIIIDLISKIKECSLIVDSLGKSIPVRVTHNDTKLNNILMDKETCVGVAIIDLDTVMPGSSLFDLGDGIRSACSNSFEDETDKNKIFLNLDLTKSYLKGFLEETYDSLTQDEITYLGLSIKILTYELVLRFLTDYINGDTYFKIKYPEHNRDRFLNQYYLLQDIETKLDEINDYIEETINDLKN
ncbi:MAG: phosphotransferase [Bacilli bacterium]|nr:phosphotransferase [Bacilli bacterium]